MTAEPAAIGLEPFRQRHWSAAYDDLAAGREQGRLAAPDFERFAFVCELLGRRDETVQLSIRAHQEYLAGGDIPSAARCAFWLGMALMELGEMAQAGGWFGRAVSILEEAGVDCVECGLVRLPAGIEIIDSDPATALAIFEEVAGFARRFASADLTAMSRLGRAQALVRLGRQAEAAQLLDEIMVAVIAGDISTFISGVMYCAVIEVCQLMFDLGRAREWTAALTRWCESQPDLVLFRGRCLIYRAEVMQLHGEWNAAIREAEQAGSLLEGEPAVGAAWYRQGEIHRLRGEIEEAEAAFRRAEEQGRRPEPGRALLRLSQGRIEAAANAIRHAIDEVVTDPERLHLLPAAVEIFLAAGQTEAAREAAGEEERVAARFAVPYVAAAAERALGAVALVDGNPRRASEHIRKSLALFQNLTVPYDVARTRELLADAALALGDDETARIHLDAARQTYTNLGARLDLARLAGSPGDPESDLTAREIEVLRLVATGMTNRAIASTLVISEKTAANHVSNILSKLALSSRAAATAYAYERGLI